MALLLTYFLPRQPTLLAAGASSLHFLRSPSPQPTSPSNMPFSALLPWRIESSRAVTILCHPRRSHQSPQSRHSKACPLPLPQTVHHPPSQFLPRQLMPLLPQALPRLHRRLYVLARCPHPPPMHKIRRRSRRVNCAAQCSRLFRRRERVASGKRIAKIVQTIASERRLGGQRAEGTQRQTYIGRPQSTARHYPRSTQLFLQNQQFRLATRERGLTPSDIDTYGGWTS